MIDVCAAEIVQFVNTLLGECCASRQKNGNGAFAFAMLVIKKVPTRIDHEP